MSHKIPETLTIHNDRSHQSSPKHLNHPLEAGCSVGHKAHHSVLGDGTWPKRKTPKTSQINLQV